MFGCADTEQGQAAGEHRPGGFGNGQPGAVGGRGFLVADGQRRRGVLEVEEGVRGVFEMPGEPVGRAVAGGGGEGLGVVGQRAQQCGCVDILVVRAVESEERGATGERAGPGVGVADEEQRVSGALYEKLVAERGPVVPGRPQQPPPDGIAPEPLQQLARGGTRGKGPDDGGRRSRLPGASMSTPSRAQSGSGGPSQPVRTSAPWVRAMVRSAWAVTAALTSRAWLNCTMSPASASPCPYRAARASTSRTSASRARASADASSVKFRNPGPVTSTRPIPGAPATRSRRISATSRAGRAAAPASWSATAQA